MSDILAPIKAIDLETLQARTKISPTNLKALLERDFSRFHKVQFLGFVSILEREFKVDLSGYKDEFYAQSDSVHEETPEIKSFISEKEPKQQTNRKVIIFVILGLLLLGFFAYKIVLSSQEKEPIPLNDTAIIEAKEQLVVAEKQELLVQQNERNATVEEDVEQEATTQESEDPFVSKVVILPKRRLWMGLINMENGKRVQEIIDSGYELNTSTSWLIVFGHGHLDIEYNKELLEFTDRKKLWFIYQNGQLQQINKNEFRRENGGRTW